MKTVGQVRPVHPSDNHTKEVSKWPASGMRALRAYRKPATHVQKPSEDAISYVLVRDVKPTVESAAIGTCPGLRGRREK
jgi:hypothetical protein